MTEKKKPQSDLADKFIVRMPDGLRDRIAFAAAKNGRAMNAEIVITLEQTYPEIPGWQQFQNEMDFLLHAYKDGNPRWSREEMLQLISTVVYQIAHHRPDKD